MKGERMAKRSTFGSIMRKRLSDITNSQSQLQSKILGDEEKPSQVSIASEDLVEQLITEKMTLMKHIEERNKIIELSANELRSLRANLQKLQLQNWNLAQSNSQILAELNLGREKMKALQHELVCKDALLKAKNMEKEDKTDTTCASTGFQEEKKVTEDSLPKVNNNDKPHDHNRRRGVRSKSMGPSTTNRKVSEKENVENKRRCLRRQSARFKSQEQEPVESFFEVENIKLPVTVQLDNSTHEDVSIQAGSSTTNEETCDLRNQTQASRRSSMGRPLRRATEKVQSYKEIPINVKMRRKE